VSEKLPPHLLYKDISYSLLRSFCETARLGSMSAAAKSLQLSHPTVWRQIRALEQLLETVLVESDGRRSELTEAGRMLADLASPVVKEFESLQDRFQQLTGTAPRKLSVAAAPRSFTDDLIPVIGEFRERYPRIQLMMREAFLHQGNSLLESGEVDIVIGDIESCAASDDIVMEPVYDILPFAIMPLKHPLAKRKRILPEDLVKYPILNHPSSYPDEENRLTLRRIGAFDHPDRGYELVLAASIRACVKAGHGIGLVGRVSQNGPIDPEICERSLSHFLSPTHCFSFRIRRVTEDPSQRAFIDLLKERLGSPQDGSGK
jgi:molybdate transport repressor ModE-like protein